MSPSPVRFWFFYGSVFKISKNDSPMLPSLISSVLTVTSSTVVTISLFTQIRGTLVIRCFFTRSLNGSDDPSLTLNVTRVGILFSIDALFTRLWYWIVGWFDSPCYYFYELRHLDLESNVILNGRCLPRFDWFLAKSILPLRWKQIEKWWRIEIQNGSNTSQAVSRQICRAKLCAHRDEQDRNRTDA